MRVSDIFSEMERVENYPDFENLARVIQHGRQRFLVKDNIEGESVKANDLSHILPVFSGSASETVVQIN